MRGKENAHRRAGQDVITRSTLTSLMDESLPTSYLVSDERACHVRTMSKHKSNEFTTPLGHVGLLFFIMAWAVAVAFVFGQIFANTWPPYENALNQFGLASIFVNPRGAAATILVLAIGALSLSGGVLVVVFKGFLVEQLTAKKK